MSLYYVETVFGCGLREARSITQARSQAIREIGTDNFKSIRKATKKDVDWVRGMGGHVPGGAK